MYALVVYDSQFGNTEKLAKTIGSTLRTAGLVEVLHVELVNPNHLEDLKALIVGSPTQRFRPTENITRFLKNIPAVELKRVNVAAFDTRLTVEEIERQAVLAFFVRIFGYAAKPIADGLVKKGGRLIAPPEGFYVQGMEGPLVDGELERAEAWAAQLNLA
jgi:flavodoxin